MDHEKIVNGLTAFLKKFKVFILGVTSFVSSIYVFLKLFGDKDTESLTYIILAVGVSLLLLICLYFAFFWERESQNKGSSIVSLPTTVLLKAQKKREKKRRVIRYFSFLGLILIPILTIFGFKSWQYVQNLPSKDINILVADFDGPDPMNYRVSEKIRENLKDGTKAYSNVKIKALNQIIKESEKGQDGSEVAREEGRKNKATIVIWGCSGDDKVSLRFTL